MMIRGTLLLILFFNSAAVAGQGENEIPSVVKQQFLEDFVSAAQVSWQKIENDGFRVNFFHQSHYKFAWYSAEGLRIRTETVLFSLHQVPASVSHSIKRKFRKYVVDESVLREDTFSGEKFYRFTVRRDERVLTVFLDADGRTARRADESMDVSRVR